MKVLVAATERSFPPCVSKCFIDEPGHRRAGLVRDANV